ncbi:hypothetical protein CHCC20335_3527 [Bacillus paralicheniformis]|nr:hypothetical protein CHCC20335_3527 [Bacillus paralicheniformis]
MMVSLYTIYRVASSCQEKKMNFYAFLRNFFEIAFSIKSSELI